MPSKELQTGLHCTPASSIYSKRDANAMKYLRYQRRRKKVPPACRGRCLKGCEQSWYETHAIQNPGIHEQSYNKNVVAKCVSNLLCFTVYIYIYIYTLYIYIYAYVYVHIYIYIYSRQPRTVACQNPRRAKIRRKTPPEIHRNTPPAIRNDF